MFLNRFHCKNWLAKAHWKQSRKVHTTSTTRTAQKMIESALCTQKTTKPKQKLRNYEKLQNFYTEDKFISCFAIQSSNFRGILKYFLIIINSQEFHPHKKFLSVPRDGIQFNKNLFILTRIYSKWFNQKNIK